MHWYERQWAVEADFSAIKRTFGETVRALSIKGMISKAVRVFISYTIIISD
jgi:hypothetical protein